MSQHEGAPTGKPQQNEDFEIVSEQSPLPPTTPAAFLAISLLTVARRLRADLDQRLATLGLNLRGFATLGHLSRQPGLSYSELARRTDITVQSMHVLVRTLQANGLVAASTSAPGTPASLTLTDKGREALRRARRAVIEVETLTFRFLTTEERAELGRLLFASLDLSTANLEP